MEDEYIQHVDNVQQLLRTFHEQHGDVLDKSSALYFTARAKLYDHEQQYLYALKDIGEAITVQ